MSDSSPSNPQSIMALEYVAAIRKSGGPRDHKDQLLVDLADELKDHMWWERTAAELLRQRDEQAKEIARLRAALVARDNCLHKSGCSEPVYKSGMCEKHYLEAIA